MQEPGRFELPFPLSEYEDRLRRVRHAMRLGGVDVQVVMDRRDLYWLAGTRVVVEQGPGDNQLIVWDGDPIMVVRHLEASSQRYSTWIESFVEYDDEGPITPYDPMKKVAEKLKELGLDEKRIGVNFRLATLQNFNRLRSLLPKADFRDFRVESIRVVKSKLEQECQFRAAKANQDALMDTINDMEIGWTQRDIERSIAAYQEKYLGKDYEKTELLCMVGRGCLHMHAEIYPGEAAGEVIKEDTLVYIEPGAFVKRYVGSMIRSVYFGDPPPAVKEAGEAVIEALNRAIEATEPGKTCHEVDKAAREYLVKKGLESRGRIGYSNGIDWSEANILSIEPHNPAVLVPGHIFHYIPIVYVTGWGYIGTSEQVLVTEDGCEVLADRDRTCPREFFVKSG